MKLKDLSKKLPSKTSARKGKLQPSLPRCYVCNTPLGESSNALFVEGSWIHYSCAFGKTMANHNKKQGKIDVFALAFKNLFPKAYAGLLGRDNK